MSSSVKNSVKSAVSFNARFATKTKINKLPTEALDMFPDLYNDSNTQEFYKAVIELQNYIWPEREDLCDGMFGNATISGACKSFNFIDEDDNYWVSETLRYNFHSDFSYINYDQKGGLDLHKFGNFSRRKRKPKIIVVHWGGLNVDHCYRVFATKDRKVSSHAGIGFDDKGQNLSIKQFLDLDHKSWHAGWVNDFSIGIDICQQPDLKWASYYSKRNYNIHEMINSSGRGPKKCLSLDPKIRDATFDAVKTLCGIYAIPFKVPRDKNGNITNAVLDKDFIKHEFEGVIGHHHITSSKWDCAPWWSDLFSEI